MLHAEPALSLPSVSIAPHARVLAVEEPRVLLEELENDNSSLGRAIQLITRPGVRKNEALSAQWEEVYLNKPIWAIPSSRKKNRTAHVVPLSPRVLSILLAGQATKPQSGPIFPSPTANGKQLTSVHSAKERLRAQVARRVGTPSARDHWTIHDLRRTVATGIHGLHNEEGSPLISSHVVERILNHKVDGVRGVYNRYDYLRQKRVALRVWSDYLDALTAAEGVMMATPA